MNGVVTVVANPPSDTVSIIDLKASPPRVIGEVAAPVSVVGPPLSIAVTPDESLAIVTASNKVDPKDATKQAPNDQVTVIDLKATPPTVLATLKAGQGASGVSVNRAGTLALVSTSWTAPSRSSPSGADGRRRARSGRRREGAAAWS